MRFSIPTAPVCLALARIHSGDDASVINVETIESGSQSEGGSPLHAVVIERARFITAVRLRGWWSLVNWQNVINVFDKVCRKNAARIPCLYSPSHEVKTPRAESVRRCSKVELVWILSSVERAIYIVEGRAICSAIQIRPEGISGGGCFAGCELRGNWSRRGIGWFVFGSGTKHRGAERLCHKRAGDDDLSEGVLR